MSSNQRAHDLESGRQFGRLSILHRDGTDKYGNRLWMCSCKCGNTKRLSSASLIGGYSVSCGCKKREQNFRHGFASRKLEHPLYSRLSHAKLRCEDPYSTTYENYGGRGIRFFPSIHGNLANAIPLIERSIGLPPSPNMTLDRINNDGDYEVGNLRWATASMQMNNRRKVITKCSNSEIVAEVNRRGGWDELRRAMS